MRPEFLRHRARIRTAATAAAIGMVAAIALTQPLSAGAADLHSVPTLMPWPVCHSGPAVPQSVVAGLPTHLQTICVLSVPRDPVAVADHGDVTINSYGAIFYTADPEFRGIDTITVSLPIGGLPSMYSASFQVEAVDNAVAHDDEYSLAAGGQLFSSVGIRVNDTVPGPRWLIQQGATPTQHGSLVLDTTTGQFVYKAEEGFTGDDHFVYRLTGPDSGESNVAMVTFHVG